jgi:hypothetical protein
MLDAVKKINELMFLFINVLVAANDAAWDKKKMRPISIIVILGFAYIHLHGNGKQTRLVSQEFQLFSPRFFNHAAASILHVVFSILNNVRAPT